MAIKASNQVSILDITDAYSVILTSEAYTFIGNTSGAPSGLTCTTQVVAYCGTQQCSKVSIGTITCPTGISATITDNNTVSPTIAFKTTATVTVACEAIIPIMVDGITINKKFSFAVAKTGTTGATGKGVKSSAVTYQDSTSGTTVPTGTWLTYIPSVPAGSYLWTKTVITYTDNTTTTSYSVGKMGSTGSTGATGKGIKTANVTYQASSSGTTTPTGTWSTSVPKTSASTPYLWTRTIITYTDDTTTTSYSVGSTPESVRSDIDEAAKTATNFLGYDSTNGLQIGNKTSGSWSGFRTRITSSTFDILNTAGSIVASYGAKLIELGKNATDAVIKLCGGKGEIKYNSTNKSLDLTGPRVRLIGTEYAGFEGSYVDVDNLINVNSKMTLSKNGMVIETEGFNGYSESSGWINPVSFKMLFNHTGFLIKRDGQTQFSINDVGKTTLGELKHPINMHAMSVRATSSLSLSTSVQKVYCNTEIEKRTSLLECSNDGGIKCVQDGYVIVFGFAYAKSLTSGDTISISVYKNSSVYGAQRTASSASEVSGHLPIRIIPVSVGDIIYMYARNCSGARGVISASTSTVMTVMYIG